MDLSKKMYNLELMIELVPIPTLPAKDDVLDADKVVHDTVPPDMLVAVTAVVAGPPAVALPAYKCV
jgi:hypothetical protein